eukprot:TRINITY_DN5959_c0_g1_i4.p1 TRINITY_DN5959_c0_g1~~TRINITY_DN5959_c0_g1_i4.p1  ORF type:complete len:545 (+),score=145.98 TRINITY_DN5959_c0_g1_i4:51-1637(+)
MSAESEAISNLYKYSDALDAASTDDERSKLVQQYTGILDYATKEGAGPKTKYLSTSLIPRYFKFFPDLAEKAVSALIDLCEEEELQTRVLSVKALTSICKDSKEFVGKVADILGQLLQAEIPTEQDNAKTSLVTIIKIEPIETIKALFNQITNRDENQREKAISFLKEKLPTLQKEVFSPNPEVEEELSNQISKVLSNVTGEEFQIFMDILSSLKINQGPNIKKLLVLLSEQADLHGTFKATDTDNLEKLLTCIDMSFPYLKQGAVTEHSFINYLCKEVFPELSKLDTEHQNRVIQAVAELSPFATTDEARSFLPSIFGTLETKVPKNTEVDASELPWIQLESLLFAFHHLGSKAPGSIAVLTGVTPVYTGQPSDLVQVEDAESKLRNFTEKLTVISSLSEILLKEINGRLKSLAQDKEKYSAAQSLLKSCNNIREMVKALAKPKPVFYGKTSGIILSFLKDQKRKQVPGGAKSEQAIKKNKGVSGLAQGVYTPPARREGGNTTGTFFRGRGRGGNRGFRGRGRGRGY